MRRHHRRRLRQQLGDASGDRSLYSSMAITSFASGCNDSFHNGAHTSPQVPFSSRKSGNKSSSTIHSRKNSFFFGNMAFMLVVSMDGGGRGGGFVDVVDELS